ncbi:MAG: cation transporter [Dermatophilaceae bacterium]
MGVAEPAPAPAPAPTTEARALRVSAAAGVALAVLGMVWGVLARSQVILFDGIYAILGFVMSWVALRASVVVSSGPSPRYPFGREALAPIVVVAQALVLLGTFGYACVDAVLVILDGGGATSVDAALLYSLIALAAAVATRVLLVRRQADSDLVAAEAAQWGAAAVLGIAMVVGFGVAALLARGPWPFLAPYVDPALVLVAAALILPTPTRMLRTSFRELLEGVPDPEVSDPIHEAVAAVCAQVGLGPPQCRISKLGRKVYVELDFLVDPADGWTVSDPDRIRGLLAPRLNRPGRILWLNVELHTDPAWDV